MVTLEIFIVTEKMYLTVTSETAYCQWSDTKVMVKFYFKGLGYVSPQTVLYGNQ